MARVPGRLAGIHPGPRPIADWYPYPFLDVAEHGAAYVAVYCVVIAVGFTVVIALVAWVGNRLGERRRAAVA